MADNPRYPIGAVAKLTGIAVETLRAWERRYRIVDPGRDGRGRMYSEADVRKLRLLRKLVDHGHAIGRLATLGEDDLRALETDPGERMSPAAHRSEGVPGLQDLTSALERFDGPLVQRELQRFATLMPPRPFVREVVLPLLRLVGVAWCRGGLSIAQEHLASATIRSLLGSLLRLHAPEEPRVTLVFATPPGERHELGLLAAAMLAVAGGLGAVYLGPELPADEIATAARRCGARAVVLAAMCAEGTQGAEDAVRALSASLPRSVELWLGGPPHEALAVALRGGGGRYLPDFDALEEELARVGARF